MVCASTPAVSHFPANEPFWTKPFGYLQTALTDAAGDVRCIADRDSMYRSVHVWAIAASLANKEPCFHFMLETAFAHLLALWTRQMADCGSKGALPQLIPLHVCSQPAYAKFKDAMMALAAAT